MIHMITRRAFWKKTVGVATAAIAAITGKSVVEAGSCSGEQSFRMGGLSYSVSGVNERKTIREILSKKQFAELELAAKDCKNGELFTHKKIRWMKFDGDFLPLSHNITQVIESYARQTPH